VSILLLQTRSAQVSALGLVNRAGRYPLDTVNSQVHVIANPRLDEPVKPEDVLHVGESIF
jgi:protein involved in polysaccharide export with SLBB domain